MGGFLPNTDAERQEMLRSLGCNGTEELYAAVPDGLRVSRLNLAPGKSELEVRRTVEALAERNVRFSSIFRGAGSYWHYIPSVVRTVASKEEFVTAYTPYQAEISQGILQSIFEYQTMICSLTGMDVSNASVYDGATAAAEAVIMCQERRRSKAVVSGAVNPQVLEVIATYCASRGIPMEVVPPRDGATDAEGIRAALDGQTACLYFQQPNYFGVLEDGQALCALAHEAGAKAIMGVNPIALGLVKTPGECGADVAVGEGQPLGIPMSFGGPYLGFMAATQAMMRRLPGRIVGQTTDDRGRRVFVLTLQAREQHIRREKASSNICSNEALCALTAGCYLSAMGPAGLADCAEQCMSKAHYLQRALCALPGFSLVYGRPFFHEFFTTCPIPGGALEELLARAGILGGLPIEGGVLWCATEQNSRDEMDRLVKVIEEASRSWN